MTQFNKLQNGYFLDFSFWQDAYRLLKAQLALKKGNKKTKPSKHFNTLNFFYYEQKEKKFDLIKIEKYFNDIIANNLFYGLDDEVFFFKYPLPKKTFGIRKYSFFSIPMKLTYYSIGLYLLKLSQEYLESSGYIFDIKKKGTFENKKVIAFYGGTLRYDDKGNLPNKMGYDTLHYWQYHLKYKYLISEHAKKNSKNKVFIYLDVQNYFENISISTLLNLLDDKNRIDSIKKEKYKFDESTKKLIEFFFTYLSNGKVGIPQGDNNIISSFIAHLYLVFGDNFILEIINNINIEKNHIIEDYKLFRYVDDIYISLDFRSSTNIVIKQQTIYHIIELISEKFYKELNLRFNDKSDIFFLELEGEKKRLKDNLKNVSIEEAPEIKYKPMSEDLRIKFKELEPLFSLIQGFKTFSPKELESMKLQRKVNILLHELTYLNNNIDKSILKAQNQLNIENLKGIYDETIQNLINKPENKNNLNDILSNFNFDVVKIAPQIIIVLISYADKKYQEKLLQYLINKDITLVILDIIVKFLCQNNFDLDKYDILIQKLKTSTYYKPIIEKFSQSIISPISVYSNISRDLFLKFISKYEDISIIEQIRLRKYREKTEQYSVALNHLVNEFQGICYNLESIDKKENERDAIKTYDRSNVEMFLKSQNVSGDLVANIINMFKRRNLNQISHAKNDEAIASAITHNEYIDFRNTVEECLKYLFDKILFDTQLKFSF